MYLFRPKKSIWQKEWDLLVQKEEIYRNKRESAQPNLLEEKVSSHVPQKLGDTLTMAFEKALALVQEQGKSIVEKTYDRDQQEHDYTVRDFAADLRLTKKTARAFRHNAGKSKTSSVAISCVEGVGLGLLGIGLADIPILMGVIFRSLHQIAMSYGFEIDSEEEKLFALVIMETAMARGKEFVLLDDTINAAINRKQGIGIDMSTQRKKTAQSLANELLCMKFIQGIPLVGAIGGISDYVAVKLISDHGELKYRRRFLLEKLKRELSL